MFDLVAFALAVAAEQRRNTVSFSLFFNFFLFIYLSLDVCYFVSMGPFVAFWVLHIELFW